MAEYEATLYDSDGEELYTAIIKEDCDSMTVSELKETFIEQYIEYLKDSAYSVSIRCVKTKK